MYDYWMERNSHQKKKILGILKNKSLVTNSVPENADGVFPVVCVQFRIAVEGEMSLLEEILYIKVMIRNSEDEEVIKGANGHSEM